MKVLTQQYINLYLKDRNKAIQRIENDMKKVAEKIKENKNANFCRNNYCR